MNNGQYIFSQVIKFLAKRKFERIMEERIKNNIEDKTMGWKLSYWSQLLVLIFGQLLGSRSLRELATVFGAHKKKTFHLGFGKDPVDRNILSRCNNHRDWHVFETFSNHMIQLAQSARIDTEFCISGKFYAFDSSTIDLCLSVFGWARFRSTKAGIKLHTQLDIVTHIPTMVHITEAAIHDVNAMDMIDYEPLACYIFDRGYWDLARLFRIEQNNSFFILREKRNPAYEVVAGEDLLEEGNIIRDQTVRFTTKRNREKLSLRNT